MSQSPSSNLSPVAEPEVNNVGGDTSQQQPNQQTSPQTSLSPTAPLNISNSNSDASNIVRKKLSVSVYLLTGPEHSLNIRF